MISPQDEKHIFLSDELSIDNESFCQPFNFPLSLFLPFTEAILGSSTLRPSQEPKDYPQQGKRHKKERNPPSLVERTVEDSGINIDAEQGEGHDPHGVFDNRNGKYAKR